MICKYACRFVFIFLLIIAEYKGSLPVALDYSHQLYLKSIIEENYTQRKMSA